MNDDPKLDWADVEIFCHLAEFGSIREAARKTELSVETTRRRLTNLELRLGKRLFRRSNSGLVITKFGESTLAHAIKAKDAIQEISNEAGCGAGARSQVYTTTLPEELCLGWTPSASFLQNLGTKGISLNLVQGSNNDPNNSRETDILFSTRLPENQDLLCRKVGSISYKLHYARSEYREPVSSLADLSCTDIQTCEWSNGQEISASLKSNLSGQGKHPALMASSLQQVLSFILSGKVVGVLPAFPQLISRNALTTMEPEISQRDIWVSYHHDVVSDERGKYLVSSLYSEMKSLVSERQQRPSSVGRAFARHL